MKNEYEVMGDIVVIYLNKRKSGRIAAIIDLEDFDKVNSHTGTWSPRLDPQSDVHYVEAHVNLSGKKTSMKLHRLILDVPQNKQVDHINHNPLDNRKSNLRIVEHFENSQNRRLRKDNKTGIRGVYWDNHHRKWKAKVTVKQKCVYQGYFDDIKLAEQAANENRMKYMEYLRDINV
jgi:hypothetical protein